MTNTNKICSNCKQLLDISSKKCTICGQQCSGHEVGHPVAVKLYSQETRPNTDEINQFKNVIFKKTNVSGPELKRALGWLVGGIILGPFCLIFGINMFAQWFTGQIQIFGAAVSFPFLLLGVGLGMICGFFYGFSLLFRDGRKKTPLKAFQWVWKESYFSGVGGLFSYTDKRMAYAYKSVARTFPKDIFEKIKEIDIINYIKDTCNQIMNILNEADNVKTDCVMHNKVTNNNKTVTNWSGTDYSCHFNDKSQETISDDVVRINCEVEFTKYKTTQIVIGGDSNTYRLAVSRVILVFKSYIIKNGEFWIPHNIMPKFIADENKGNAVLPNS